MRSPLLAAALLLLTACGDLEHENAFDPETPPDRQATVALAGTVELESVDGSFPTLSGISVSLAGTRHVAVTGAGGEYTIAGVPPGSWQLQAAATGYDTVTLTGIVTTLNDGGKEYGLPTLTLPVSRGDVAGAVSLKLPNGLADASGGASVSLTGLPGSQLTDPSGSFFLGRVPIGIHQLSASKPGFLTRTTTVAVTRNAVYDLGTMDVEPDPGALEGFVQVLGAIDASGVLVRARGTTLGGTPWESSAHSFTDGTWLVSGIAAGSYTVSYELADYGTVMTSVTVNPGTLTALPPVDLVRDNGSVYGVATLEGAADHAGIQVLITASPPPDPVTTAAVAITDAAGNWRVDGLPVGDYSIVFRSQPGYDDAVGLVTVAAKRAVPSVPSSVELAMRPATLTGRVLLEGRSASALDGTTVAIEGLSVQGLTSTDGSYVLTDVPAGTWQLRFERTGFDVQKAQISIAAGEVVSLYDVALAVSRGSLTGAFALDGMTSSGGIVVTATGPASTSTVTATDGTFSMTGLPVGTYSVAARKDPEWQPATVSGVVVAAGLTTTLPAPAPTLSPVTTASMSGTVLLEAAASHGSTGVTLSGNDFRGVVVARSTTTAPDGTWSLSGVAAGTYQVAYDRSDYDAPAPTGVALGTGQAAALGTTTLPASRGAVGGTAIAAGAADAAGTLVTVSGGPDTASTVTDAAGTFTVSGLRVGTGYVASFHRTGYAPASSDAFAITADTTTALASASLTLDTRAAISGAAAVERPAGADAGILVALTGVDLNGAAVTRSTSTDPDGHYTLVGLPQGTYALGFSKDAYRAQSLAGLFVAVAAGATAVPVVLHVATGTIAGTVALSAGSVTGFPVGTDRSGAVVTLAGVDVPVPSAVTDTAGNYRFQDVPVSVTGASYAVTARAPAFRADTAAVTAAADATVLAPALTLAVDAGAIAGTVLLKDAVGGGGDNALHAGTTVSVTGTAFNGTSWSAAGVTADDGRYTIPALPPGTFDVLATDPARTCGALPSLPVPPGGTATAPLTRCLDAVAPTAVSLGAPQPPAGGQAGYTDGASVVVPVSTPADDDTLPISNFRGYQLAMGPSPDWNAAAVVEASDPLAFSGLPLNARTLLWVRPIDWIGNTGPAAAVEIVQDDLPPPTPTVTTPRPIVNATTSSVTLTGSEGDANFLGYESCTEQVAATAACATAPGCTFTAAAASLVVSLGAGLKSCVFARALDRAGNASEVASVAVTSDLSAPTPPTFVPSFDPYLMTVRAPRVDFFLATAATDSPGAGGPWVGVSHIEVDTGSGFAPLCALETCHLSGTFAPCGCGCTDDRLLCDGARFVGIRASLAEGVATTVAFRAVDLAGNVGAGVSQQVFSDSTSDILSATSETEMYPQVLGSLVGYAIGAEGWLLDLGTNRRVDADDARCMVSSYVGTGWWTPIVPVNAGLVAFANVPTASLRIRRLGPSGWCSTEGDATVFDPVPVPNPSGIYKRVEAAAGSGETLLFVERDVPTETYSLRAREPGPDGKVGTADEAGTDGLVGTADDSFTGTVATYSYVYSLFMGGRTAIVYQTACSPRPCYGPFSWQIVDATATSAFYAGATVANLPATVGAAAISGDGREIAYVEDENLKLRTPGPNGRFDDGGDDVVLTKAIPAGLSVFRVVVDGPHVLGVTSLNVVQPVSYLLHWWAGADGIWGSPDDLLETTRPSSAEPYSLSLSGGLVALQLAGDLVSADLSTRRWEVAPSAAIATSYYQTPPLATNATGTLFFATSGGPIVSRSASGLERTGPNHPLFTADGANLVTSDHESVWIHGAGASGLFFGTDALTPVRVLQGPMSYGVKGLASGEGKAIVAVELVPGVTSYRILEPRAGSLRDVLTTGRIVDPYPAGMNSNWASTPAITARQALFHCDGINGRICVYGAGLDAEFGGSDDVLSFLVHPPNSPLVGQYYGQYGFATYVEAVGDLLMVSEGTGTAAGVTYLVDAGVDRLFNTPDDVERKLADLATYPDRMAVRGNWAAYLDDVAPGGLQVHVVQGFDGPVQVVTDYWSPKRSLALDPTGRVYWADGVFAPEGIMVWAP